MTMQNRHIAVTLECFVRKKGKYLMLHRSKDKKILPGVWMAPGGHREFNEGLFACARREIFEETGLRIKNLQIKAQGNAYLHDVDKEFYFHFVFADYAGGKLKQNKKDGDLIWLTPKEIMKLDNVLTEIKEVAPYIFKKDKKVLSYKAVYETGNKLSSLEIEKP